MSLTPPQPQDHDHHSHNNNGDDNKLERPNLWHDGEPKCSAPEFRATPSQGVGSREAAVAQRPR